jgi:hypothetical protein
MKYKILQGLAIIFILETGLTHFFSAQHEFEEAAVLGYLFMANFVGALLAAYGIYRHKIWGWGFGGFIALGSIIGYIYSRTTGLPGLQPEAWLNNWGLVALAVEGLFIVIVFLLPWRSAPASDQQKQTPAGIRYLLPAAGMLALVLMNYATFQLEALLPAGDHEHFLSASEVQNQTVISEQTLEENYGMQVSLVALSAMNSIVDVRIKILDPEKAIPLLEDHSALFVNDALILAPHMHRHALKEGKPIVVFYPNPQNIIKSGTPVSLVFGNIRLEPIITK